MGDAASTEAQAKRPTSGFFLPSNMQRSLAGTRGHLSCWSSGAPRGLTAGTGNPCPPGGSTWTHLWLLQRRLWPLEMPPPRAPRGCDGCRSASEAAGRKEDKGGTQQQRVNRTSRLHRTQRSHLPSRCTQQQCAVTRWWPRHCPRRPASLAPAAPQPCAAGSLVGWRRAGHYGHHSQQARRTWAWWHQKAAVV